MLSCDNSIATGEAARGWSRGSVIIEAPLGNLEVEYSTMGIDPRSTIIGRQRPFGARRTVDILILAIFVLCPLSANAAKGTGAEALTKGQSYVVPAVPYCINQDALHALVDLRRSADLDTLPDGCFSPSAAKFSSKFKGFIPDYKVTGITVPEKLTTPNRYGKSSCTDPDTGATVNCTMRIIESGFLAGTLVGADSSRTTAFIEVGYGIEVSDPRSGDLQFAPLAAKPATR
jgi:hypothetical protein